MTTSITFLDTDPRSELPELLAYPIHAAGSEGCRALDPEGLGLICTRPSGHDGPHVAHAPGFMIGREEDFVPVAKWGEGGS